MNRPLRLAECFVGISWVGVTLLVNRSQHYRNPSAAVGPIYRARIYVNTHEMEGEMRVR